MWAVVRTAAMALFGDDIFRWMLYGLGGLLAIAYLEATGATQAMLAQPWGQWWLAGTMGGQKSATVAAERPGGGISLPVEILPPLQGNGPAPSVPAGRVSDVDRWNLIRAAGAPPDVAIVMVALSIAEDGSGNPSIVSPPNRDGSVDNGLWQVNSSHIGECGIPSQAWLFDPMNNARAAMCILGPHLNYCAWSTFEVSCGKGYTGAYRAFLGVAACIAEGRVCQH